MKKPWLPYKPHDKPRCKACKGNGKSFFFHPFEWKLISCACPKCGGKGFLG